MTEWEYRTIDLNQHGSRSDEVELLNAAGADGWELVGITGNFIAYLKRAVAERAPMPAEDRYPAVERNGDAARDEMVASAHRVKVKYRDPLTNETWTGRGRMATWLKRKQDAGEDIEKYLV